MGQRELQHPPSRLVRRRPASDLEDGSGTAAPAALPEPPAAAAPAGELPAPPAAAAPAAELPAPPPPGTRAVEEIGAVQHARPAEVCDPEKAMTDIVAQTVKALGCGRWVSNDTSLPNTAEFWVRLFANDVTKRPATRRS